MKATVDFLSGDRTFLSARMDDDTYVVMDVTGFTEKQSPSYGDLLTWSGDDPDKAHNVRRGATYDVSLGSLGLTREQALAAVEPMRPSRAPRDRPPRKPSEILGE